MYALYGTLFPEVAVKLVFKVAQNGNTQVKCKNCTKGQN